MPTLHWIGKDKVINHHQDVPFRLLDHQYGALADGTQTTEPTGSGNQIIHGDNLEALKALLPQYEGRVKCIYIDPPYNTGKEGWTYNDNVSDPKLRKWLEVTLQAKSTGKDAGIGVDDLSRHDKWLCMIYPRLKLLHKLLSEDGSLWISIDDTECFNLKMALDEIFGLDNFVADIIWKKRDSPPNDRTIGSIHEHILVYGKAKSGPGKKTLAEEQFNLLQRTEKSNADYKVFTEPNGPDPKGPFRKIDTTANGKGGRFVASLFYGIINPYTKEEVFPRQGTCWRHNQEDMKQLEKENRLYWGVKGEAKTPMRKLYLFETRQGMTIPSIWYDIALNQHGSGDIEKIFGEKAAFDTPKPVDLIQQIVHIATDKDSIILDSFAGSGTTAHAVLKLNQQDGGNRKFILTEMEDYAEHITAERVKRVMQGYAGQPGTGGSFDYLTLGEPVFTESGDLNEQAGLPGLRQYLYYAETKQPLPADTHDDNASFLGQHDGAAYYFHYAPSEVTTLDHEFLSTIRTKAGQYIIYADNCLLTPEFMTQHGLIFKKIPRDISRF
jgi:adenine-specific DNA-methyltransferase